MLHSVGRAPPCPLHDFLQPITAKKAGIRQPLLPRSRSSRLKVPAAPCLKNQPQKEKHHSVGRAPPAPPDHLHRNSLTPTIAPRADQLQDGPATSDPGHASSKFQQSPAYHRPTSPQNHRLQQPGLPLVQDMLNEVDLRPHPILCPQILALDPHSLGQASQLHCPSPLGCIVDRLVCAAENRRYSWNSRLTIAAPGIANLSPSLGTNTAEEQTSAFLLTDSPCSRVAAGRCTHQKCAGHSSCISRMVDMHITKRWRGHKQAAH